MIFEDKEITLTIEKEKQFILQKINAERELLLIAQVNGKTIGSYSISALGDLKRLAHRCSIGIALYQEYWG